MSAVFISHSSADNPAAAESKALLVSACPQKPDPPDLADCKAGAKR